MSKKSSSEIKFFRKLGGDVLVRDVREYEAYYKQQQATIEKPDTLNWVGLGEIVRFQAYQSGMLFTCEQGYADLFFTADDCVRVTIQREETFKEPFSYAVRDVERHPVRYELHEDDEAVYLRTTTLVCAVTKDTFQVGLHSHAGELLCLAADGCIADGGNVRLQMQLAADEAIYGLGERSHDLNLRGERYMLWNTDQPNCDRGTDPLYYNVPFYIGLHQRGAYGVFWDNTFRGFVDAGAETSDQLVFECEGGALRYYLMAGGRTGEIIARYTDLTGRADLPPLWFLGYQQNRFSYYPQAAVLELADTFRKKNIPCDAIHLDIHYMDNFKVMTWDAERFPDFTGMVAQLHARGFKVVPILDPGVKIEDGYEAYESGVRRDVFIKNVDGEPLKSVVWAGASYFPDFGKSATRDWWRDQLQTLIETGVDGFWNDMNEPTAFGTEGVLDLPDTTPQRKEADISTHVEMHNVYALLMTQATRAGLEMHRGDKRPVNITRAGSAGTQRYATSWTGDVTSDWDHLRLSIPMILNMGLSGAALTGADVGGFRASTNAELLTRWTQAAALMPFFRNHTAIDTAQQEPWAFGEPYESMIRTAIELRYRLMPYLYSVVAQYTEYGLPVVRPMFMVDERDNSLWGVNDQYMLGGSLLVAPVVEEGAESREVLLPFGDWYDFWTGKAVMGGQTITVDTPLDHLPLFVRGGSVLPVWEVQQHLSGALPKSAELRVYPGELETVLYEDAGEGMTYREGDYRWIYTTAEWLNNRFRVERRVTGHYEPPYERIRLKIYGFDEEPHSVKINRQGAPVWYYENELIELTVGEFESLEVLGQIGPSDETVVRRPL